MQSGTLNEYFYLSLAAPALIMLVAGMVRNDRLLSAAIICSLIATFLLCNLAVDLKWKIRRATAITAFEKDRASNDGGNRIFTAILVAPLEAVILTAFWGWAGCLAGDLLRSRRHRLAAHLPVMLRQRFTLLRPRITYPSQSD